MTLLNVDHIRVEFPDRHGIGVAIEDVSLNLNKGEILGIVGESGAGKSTIGNAVMGLVQTPGHLAGGGIYLNDKRIDTLPADDMRKLRGKRIGMIFQDPLTSLNPLETIEYQLVETIRLHLNLTKHAARNRAIDLLDQVGIPNPHKRIRQYPHQFSGGMRQRVVIALAICAQPDVIIADEPTTALDVSVQAQILDLIKTLCRDHNVGVILVTHDMGVIAQTADRVAVMYKGRVIETGPTADVLHTPQTQYAQSLIGSIPPSNKKLHRFPKLAIAHSDGAQLQNVSLSSHWLGSGEGFNLGEEPLLEIKNLSKRFAVGGGLFLKAKDYVDAVNDVSFAIKPGEVLGLVGESGSGKSTVARLITGIIQPDQGQVMYAGHDLYAPRPKKQTRKIRQNIQMIFQDPYSSLNARMRVKDIIAEPIYANALAPNATQRDKIAMDLLDVVGLEKAAARKYPHEFSGGQRQRISIARALATRPQFLICDEPTSALDVSIQAQLLNLLKDLQEHLNLTLLFISHDLPVIRQMCNRIAVMRHGKLVEVAHGETLFTNPQHEYTKQLIEFMPKFER